MNRRDILALTGGAAAGLALPMRAWAQNEDLLAYVHPELRASARMLLRVPQEAVKFGPPPRIPLPEGVTEMAVPGRAGAPPVPVFLLNRGAPGQAPRGAILYIHGGGFIGGGARERLRPLKRLAERLGCMIVSVEYRLAPATRFPGALEDNYAALKWLHDEAPALGVDRGRLLLYGESAGGGHAAMLALAARDRGEVPIAFQMLVYPMLDDRTGSSRPVPPQIGRIVWTTERNRIGWGALLGQPAGRRQVPAGSVPARVETLAGLPPTFIGVGSIDLFAEEDIFFARRLVRAGVPTELLVVPGAYHGFELIAPAADVSKRFVAAVEGALAGALDPARKWA